MASRHARSFIVSMESDVGDAEFLNLLADLGLEVDREYGVIRLDPAGRQRVTRVTATEDQLERAQSSVRFSFYPDLTVFRSPP